MAKSKLKPLGTHIEYSPARKKQYARAAKRREREWATKSGPVSVRNMVIDDLIIQIAAYRAAGPDGEFTVEALLLEVQLEDASLSKQTVERAIEARLLKGEHAVFEKLAGGMYRQLAMQRRGLFEVTRRLPSNGV